MKFKVLEGNALSRMFMHLDPDDNTDFALIGSLDKDDITVSHADNLLKEIFKLIDNHIDKNNKIDVSYKSLEGIYTMSSGEVIREPSYVIYNLTKEEALQIARSVNQECIIWKDKTFFGFIYTDGTEENCFRRDTLDFSNEQLEKFASRLLSKHVEGQIRFAFKLNEKISSDSVGFKRMKEQPEYITIFEYSNL